MAGREWVEIEDPGDPRLTWFRQLRDADARRAVESEHGIFVAEGVTVIRRLLASDLAVRSLLLLPAIAARLADDLAARDQRLDVADPGPTVLVGSRDVLAATAGFDVHRGALAVADRPPLPDPAEVLAGARAIAVLEGLTDHENLGAVARSARALGVDGMLLDPTCADPFYRRCVRVSMGEILLLPWTRLQPWPHALASLPEAGFTVVALTPSPGAEPIETVAASVRSRVALLLGTEGAGLSAGAMALAERHARIPMRAGVDSLNVGHAAAIAFHRLVAARGPGGP